ncbi:MAG: cardiolipin synthase, partial [Clostridia bacterium]|nr:cardiolipin synthase [Clostridia bacterium]
IAHAVQSESYIMPFGDGPYPMYEKNVGKTVIMNILNHAKDYVYITTPYLIVDNEMMKAIENTALRGVDVRIIVPHIPDKKLVFEMTKSNYKMLIKSGVKVYEYTPGFIHAKSYIADDVVGMIGTINLDYRSLTHHFENGVWMYNDKCILSMKQDFIDTMSQSQCMDKVKIKDNILNRFIRSIVRIFSPLL